MGILRADLLTHSQLQPTGSVFFDGTDDKITTTGFGNIGTSDFTLECWVYLSTTSGTQRIISANEGSQSTEYTQIRAHSTHGWQAYIGTDSGWWEAKSGNDHATFTTGWHHVVLQRFGNDGYIFVDGEYVITSNDGSSASNAADPVTITTFVLGHGYGSEYLNAGYISNARVSMSAVYGGTDFTPPKFELKPLGDTYLLCCQSSSSSSEAAVAPSAGLTVTGAAASSLTPDLKKDITDTGVVFDGFGNFATSTYMIPPTGKTTERNRGRALWMGGYSPSSYRTMIDFVNIQSTGNAIHFGELSATSVGEGADCSSSTRAIQGGGSLVNTMEFVTIANESNVTDFGDLTVARRSLDSLSSETRGIWAGGTTNPAMSDVIDFATIATTGNATDFGNLTVGRRNLGTVASPTRGVFAGGNPGSSPLTDDTIDYITIASAGNATDFGNLSGTYREGAGCSNGTRGVFAVGGPGSSSLNTLEFITIANTGNTTDFGDLFYAVGNAGGTSNRTRGVFGGGAGAAYTNIIQYVTIATQGNAKDFGDLTFTRITYSATSDSHGGIS